MASSFNTSSTKNRGIVFLIGFMGSGKSYWGRLWSSSHHFRFIDLDDEIEKHEGCSIAEIFEKKGENYFREIESLILRTFLGKENIIISCGGGTPCFNENMAWMNENGITVYLKASPQQLMMRLLPEKDKRPIIKNISDDKLEAFISKRLQEREAYYLNASIILNVESVKETTFVNIIANQH